MPSPESRLVFRSADPSGSATEFAVLAGAVTNWPRALYLAEREVATLNVWRGLREHEALVPAEAAEHLRKSAMVSDLRMQHLSRRLQHTSRVLAERGVPFLLLKGAALGAMSDPTFRARPMTDLDLLIHREDTARARAAIIDSGWPETTDRVLAELLSDHHHLPPFVDPQLPGVRIELHIALFPADQPFEFDESDLWRTARPAPAPFTGALLPTAEHLLLHSCIHFAWQHSMMFGAWRTFRVVGTLVSASDLDWDRFVRAAHAAKAATSCYWTLRLAERLSGIVVPTGVLTRLAPPTPHWVQNALERHFIAEIASGEGPASPSIRLSRLLWVAALRPKWSGHTASRRWDPDGRWERARGTLSSETSRQRLARHLAAYRAWWNFFSRTLLG